MAAMGLWVRSMMPRVLAALMVMAAARSMLAIAMTALVAREVVRVARLRDAVLRAASWLRAAAAAQVVHMMPTTARSPLVAAAVVRAM